MMAAHARIEHVQGSCQLGSFELLWCDGCRGLSCGDVQRPCAARLGVVLASLHWGLTLPQGRCGRWLLLLDILPVSLQAENALQILPCRLTCTAPLCSTPWGHDSFPPPGVDAPSGQMRQVAAIDVHIALTCTVPLLRHALGFASDSPLGVDAPSRQMRQVIADILPGQVADGGGENGRWGRNVERAAHARR